MCLGLLIPLLVWASKTSQVVSLQKFISTPKDTSVNTGASVILECVIHEIGGECTWEKDGIPVGMYPNKYAFAAGKDRLVLP